MQKDIQFFDIENFLDILQEINWIKEKYFEWLKTGDSIPWEQWLIELS